MWKSACVGIYQLLNWKMHAETLKFVKWTPFEILSNNFRFNEEADSIARRSCSSILRSVNCRHKVLRGCLYITLELIKKHKAYRSWFRFVHGGTDIGNEQVNEGMNESVNEKIRKLKNRTNEIRMKVLWSEWINK